MNVLFERATVPPKKIAIIDENGITRDKQVGPYLEGDDLELHCDVYGGKLLTFNAIYTNKI